MHKVIYDGMDKPQAERIVLRAGKLHLVYEAGQIRYITVGNREVLRGVYAAVRDQNWDTVPFVLRDVQIDAQADSFRISFTSDHQQGNIHFVWHGEIVGTADSTVRFTFDGESLTAFRRMRIGFCVLHPLMLAGQACEIEHTNGEVVQGMFPEKISPREPYLLVRAVRHEALPDVSIEVRMEGDAFEMEDQRNWSDASYKTYCTPSAIPRPVDIDARTKVQQSVTVRLMGDADAVPMVKKGNILHIDSSQRWKIPFIGLGMASHDEPLSERQFERIAALKLNQFRHELFFTEGMEDRLHEAVEDANVLELDLEVAAHFGKDMQTELARLHTALDNMDHGDVYVLLFREGEGATTRETYELAKEALDDLQSVFLVAGTDAFFTNLNLFRPPVGMAEWVVYSTNPQVHAFDNSTLIETLATLPIAAANAREFSGAAVLVSPISFKMRWNPVATATDEVDTELVTLPGNVDRRQISLFGAGWTMGAIASLARGGAESTTFFETTGWLGVMERESGSPLPDQFPSIPGAVFPMYHVFADVGDFKDGRILGAQSSEPLVFSGLALREGSRWRVLVANHTAEAQTVTITGLDGRWELKTLDETNADAAMREPEVYRAAAGQVIEVAADQPLRLDLLPYAIARLDRV